MQRLAIHWIFASILAVALLVPTVASPRPAAACSCVPPNLERQFETATVAFRGEVEEITDAGDSHYRIEFDADEFWKGDPSREMFVYTHQSSATCGATFVENREYFVLATVSGGRLETNSCLYNVDIESSGPEALAAIQALGAGVRAIDDDETNDQDDENGGDVPATTPTPTSRAGSVDDGDTQGVGADPFNVSAVVLAGLVAAAGVVLVARRT